MHKKILPALLILITSASLHAVDYGISFDISSFMVAEIGSAKYAVGLGISPQVKFNRVAGLYAHIDVIIPYIIDVNLGSRQRYSQKDFSYLAGANIWLSVSLFAYDGPMYKLFFAPGVNLLCESWKDNNEKSAGVAFGAGLMMMNEFYATEKVYFSLGLSVCYDFVGATRTVRVHTKEATHSYAGLIFALAWQPQFGVGIKF